MGLRDIIRKKDDLHDPLSPTRKQHQQYQQQQQQPAPEFVFIRSDTSNHEIIQPPEDPIDHRHQSGGIGRRSISDVFRSPRSRSASAASATSPSLPPQLQQQGSSSGGEAGVRRGSRRLSDVLHLKRDVESSDHVPRDLPEIVLPQDPSDADATESQWEKRATMLAGQNERARSISNPSSRAPSRPGSRHASGTGGGFGGAGGGSGGAGLGQVSTERLLAMRLEQAGATPPSSTGPGDDGTGRPSIGSRRASAVSSKEIDLDIQEAIRLHEAGDLATSTRLFGRLADPQGANNPLSQVLYGLALRHGWGCAPNPAEAVRHLTAAASNAASVEQLALQAGLRKGGAAKGELVLAIFELANCFRHGWGIDKDPVAAKQYYETAANLGDADAMNEVAWCYLEGHGCKKDKYAAARYYRLAEKAGNKTLGNSWIWKEKYDPPGEETSQKKKKK